MIEFLLVLIAVLDLAALAAVVTLLRNSSRSDSAELAPRLDAFEKSQERTERAVREEAAQSRTELGAASREQRQELTQSFKTFRDTALDRVAELTAMQKGQLDTFSAQLNAFAAASGERLDAARAESASGSKDLREEVMKTMAELAKSQMAQLDGMTAAITTLADAIQKKLEEVRLTVEGKLQNMQAENTKQLDQMRQTVDEKLQGTLEKRLGESFKQVSDRLEQVHKGLGEMQTLATGVGDLKKVLTNVKTRGTWGEVQLGALLEQALTQEQFEANVATKDGGERVEFAIRLPGNGTHKDDVVLLPIDAKFPIEDYQRLLDAQERADVEAVDEAAKQLENRVKNCARDICQKYLNPPKTTDFAILYLPIEGLFAEVVRRSGLTDVIQREFRVAITGPTTLWATVSSLQMGFRTLAIQKRSSEVWNLLAAVKTEWTKYGDVLEAVQTKLEQATNTIEKAKVRSRAVGRKLKDVEVFPVTEASTVMNLLPDESEADAQDVLGTS